MATICFEITELFPCQKQYADSIKLSLEASWAAWPAGSPLPLPGCLMPLALGAQAPPSTAQLSRDPHRLSPCDRNSEMLMFHSRANKMKCWQPGISQKTDVSFSGQLNLHTHTYTHTCRIINCYVITPDCVPTSTVRRGGNPAFWFPC